MFFDANDKLQQQAEAIQQQGYQMMTPEQLNRVSRLKQILKYLKMAFLNDGFDENNAVINNNVNNG
jgi:translocation and assembly module TamA